MKNHRTDETSEKNKLNNVSTGNFITERDSHLSQAQLHHQQVITAETPEDTDLCQGHLSQQQWITSDTPPEMKGKCLYDVANCGEL